MFTNVEKSLHNTNGDPTAGRDERPVDWCPRSRKTPMQRVPRPLVAVGLMALRQHRRSAARYERGRENLQDGHKDRCVRAGVSVLEGNRGYRNIPTLWHAGIRQPLLSVTPTTTTTTMQPSPTPDWRPSKRTRASRDSSPHVKYERSPSPQFADKRLVTCGTKRFAPIPSDCLPSCAGYQRNRSEWVASCVTELEAFNLVPERKLIRDDGLIIDWKSHVPVWSDTLKPDPMDLAATVMLAHKFNAQWRHTPTRQVSPRLSMSTVSTQGSSLHTFSSMSDGEPPLKKRLPAPPRPSSKRLRDLPQPVPIGSPSSRPGSSPPCSERPRLPDETERETASHSPSRDPVSSLADRVPIPADISTPHDQVSAPRNPPSVCDRLIAPSAAEQVMSEMTLDYLRRYVQTYEADRASLASAYARYASFAYRVHQIVQNTSESAPTIWATSPHRFSSGLKRTRLDIMTTLLTLPCLHSNAQSPAITQVEYDIFYPGTEFGMFVVCRVVIPTTTVVHSFILQRKEVDTEDAVIEGVWPLTATAHQILVFQA